MTTRQCRQPGNGPDLVAAARLGINYLTRNPRPHRDPALHYLPFFGGKVPFDGPPRFDRTPSDYGDGTGRFLEALLLAREMTGQTAAQEVDDGLAALLCSFLSDDDGLSYRPETPWSDFGADLWAQRGTLLALTLLYEKCGDKRLAERLERLVAGLARIAVPDQGAAYLRYLWRGDRWLADDNAGICFCVLDGLAQYAETTGSARALELAQALVRGMLERRPPYFNRDGSFAYPDGSAQVEVPDFQHGERVPEVAVAWEIANGHVTSRVSAAAGMLRLGVLTGNRDFIAAGKAVHDWIAAQGSRFGWIPENLRTAGRESNEMCNLASMLEMQLLLANVGYPEYWDQAERYVRNHLLASQFAVTPRLLELIGADLSAAAPADSDRCSYTDALRRLEGGFAGPTYPDDMFSAYPKSRHRPGASRLIDISGCCAPSGVKALHLAWKHALTKDDSGIRVHLAFSRRSEYAQVVSYLPQEGRVDVTPRDSVPIHVRLPGWVPPSQASLLIDGRAAPWELHGRYVTCGVVPAGRTLSIRYPVPTVATVETLAGITYQVAWKGDTVVGIRAEEAPLLPLYDRGYA